MTSRLSKPPTALLKTHRRQSLDSRQRCGQRLKIDGTSKWYDGVVEGAERFMVEWHQQEEAKRCARHAKEVTLGTNDRRGAGRIDNDSSSTAIEESKDEMANRVARFQVD